MFFHGTDWGTHGEGEEDEETEGRIEEEGKMRQTNVVPLNVLKKLSNTHIVI